MKYSYMIVYLGVVGLGGGSAGFTTKEAHAELFKEINTLTRVCLDEFGLTLNSFEEIREHARHEDLDPCFFQCSLEKIGFLDADGMYDHSSAIAIIEKYFKDEGRLKSLETCRTVNDAEVTAGEQGKCERALLLAKCIMTVDPDLF